jgi:hypothetical protein
VAKVKRYKEGHKIISYLSFFPVKLSLFLISPPLKKVKIAAGLECEVLDDFLKGPALGLWRKCANQED